MRNHSIRIINTHQRLETSSRSLRNNIERVLAFLGLEDCGVEVTLCDDAVMRAQNRKFMGKYRVTDVLSFPHWPPRVRHADYRGKLLGDILICLDQAERQAGAQGLAPDAEILFLAVHSILHLIGHDHGARAERLRMQAWESRIWEHLGRTRMGSGC